MKLTQEAKLTQRLALTPSLQLAIHLLQSPLLKIQLEVNRLLEMNPFLEKSNSFQENVLQVNEQGELRTLDEKNEEITFNLKEDKTREDENDFPVSAQPISLRDHLLEQVHLLDETDTIITQALIDSLDENGYLADSLEEILAILQKDTFVTLRQLEKNLAYLQSLDPAGVGARNASESLAIQLKRKEKVPFITRKHALAIVENHLTLFARHEYAKIKKIMHLDDEDLKEAIHLIQTCDPHPGAIFSTDPIQNLIPELIAFKEGKTWKVKLNPEALPSFKTSSLYGQYLKNKPKDPTLKNQFLEAHFLIRHLYQRFETILRTGRALIHIQQDYLEKGPLFLRPLVLREIADTLELHESTISRATSQKYMRTPHGIVELKYFFTRSVQKISGEMVSTMALREHIKNIIGEENKNKPLSDAKIAQMLKEKGLSIARRTIAKHRESLRIPPSFMRKLI